MNRSFAHLGVVLSGLVCTACTTSGPRHRDLMHFSFPKAQEEVRATFDSILQHALTADVEALRAGHLDSEKFTKFGGEKFERMNVQECNDSEAAMVTSIQHLHADVKDAKVDVFGDVAIMTFYLHHSFQKEGQDVRGVARVTVAFLQTPDGWKIIHEHVTPKACFDR